MSNLIWMLLSGVVLAVLIWRPAWPRGRNETDSAINVSPGSINVTNVSPADQGLVVTLSGEAVTLTQDRETGEWWAERERGVTRLTPAQAQLLERYLAQR